MAHSMSSEARTSADQPRNPLSRTIGSMLAAGFALMFLAAALLWWRYGDVIFFDMLAAAQGCF